MERIKVLHIITHLGFGGGLDNTLLTVRGHSRERYEVHLAAGEVEPGEEYTDWTARAREYADALFVFPDMRRSVQPPRDLRALRQLTALIREQNYQVVHTHTAKAGVLGRIAARRAGVPVVVHTFHSFGWQVAHAFHDSIWKNQLSSLKGKVFEAIERYGASLSDALITVADLNKQEALERNIAPPEKFTTIYSGIDLDRFATVSPDKTTFCHGIGLDPERPLVGMIGRLSTQKAPLDFISAAKQVLQAKPDTQFILVGDGPMAGEVQQAIGSEQRIKVLGFVENVPEILAILDVFALSSLWEGLGRALTEAMIMKVPVAVTRAGAMPELVVHGETGLLSPPGDAARLAENILWLLEHPEEARKLGERGHARVVPAFSGRYMVERIEALYERLLVEKGIGVGAPALNS
jgi:glycosyltransferase involved in cell wall biosynthesis